MTKLLKEIANQYYIKEDVVVAYSGEYNTVSMVTHGPANPKNNNETKTIIKVTLINGKYVLDVYQPRSNKVNDAFNIISMAIPNKDVLADTVDSYYRKIKSGNI